MILGVPHGTRWRHSEHFWLSVSTPVFTKIPVRCRFCWGSDPQNKSGSRDRNPSGWCRLCGCILAGAILWPNCGYGFPGWEPAVSPRSNPSDTQRRPPGTTLSPPAGFPKIPVFSDRLAPFCRHLLYFSVCYHQISIPRALPGRTHSNPGISEYVCANTDFWDNFPLGADSVGNQPHKFSQNQEIETRQVALEFVHVFSSWHLVLIANLN